MKLSYPLQIISTLFFVGCSNNSKNEHVDNQKEITIKNIDSIRNEDDLIVNDSAYILQTQVPFRYKELDESYLEDPINKLETSEFYGSWTISDISDVGGTVQKERTIRNQIGNKLLFSKHNLSFNFLNNEYEITNPESYIEATDTENNSETKGTTYWFGYRPSRKKIYSLVIKRVGHFEIIHYDEIAIYNDGRIYFLHKD